MKMPFSKFLLCFFSFLFSFLCLLRVDSVWFEHLEALLALLLERKQNVEAGLKVDGIKMIPLKTLHASSNQKSPVYLEIKESVGAIIDSENLRSYLEGEIEC